MKEGIMKAREFVRTMMVAFMMSSCLGVSARAEFQFIGIAGGYDQATGLLSIDMLVNHEPNFTTVDVAGRVANSVEFYFSPEFDEVPVATLMDLPVANLIPGEFDAMVRIGDPTYPGVAAIYDDGGNLITTEPYVVTPVFTPDYPATITFSLPQLPAFGDPYLAATFHYGKMTGWSLGGTSFVTLPEPGSAAMLGVGAAGMALVGLVRRRSSTTRLTPRWRPPC
jgi:hypothetical protein